MRSYERRESGSDWVPGLGGQRWRAWRDSRVDQHMIAQVSCQKCMAPAGKRCMAVRRRDGAIVQAPWNELHISRRAKATRRWAAAFSWDMTKLARLVADA